MAKEPIKQWTTEIWAVDPIDYNDSDSRETISRIHSVKWQGPHVPGATIQEAQEYCNKNGLGYCRVVGILVEEGYIDTVLDNCN